METGEPQGLDFAYPAENEIRFYHCTAWPELIKDGKEKTLVSSARDVTHKAPFIERLLNPGEDGQASRILDSVLHEVSNRLAIVKSVLYRIEAECNKKISEEIKHKIKEEKLNLGLKNVGRIEEYLNSLRKINLSKKKRQT